MLKQFWSWLVGTAATAPQSAAAKPEPRRRGKMKDAVIGKAGYRPEGSFLLTPLTEVPRIENPLAPAERPHGFGAAIAMDDGLQSFFDGFGAGAWNFSEGIGFLGYGYLSQLAQRPEYRKGSEVLAREMTRKWIKITSIGEGGNTDKLKAIEDELDRLKTRDAFRRAAELDGFFGRGHIYLDTGSTDDPDELKTPLIADRRKIKKKGLKRLTVVEPLWTYPQMYNSTDPLRKDFFQPQTWMVSAKEIHHSRMLTFVGREVPDMLKPAYAFGGLSLSQMAKPYVDNWLRTRQSVSDLLHSFTVFVLKTDLSATFSGADDGDQLFKRIDLFNKIRDNRGMMVVDKGNPTSDNSEEVENVSAPLGTLDHLQAQAQEQMASVFSIPLVILLGITPSGLNASSDGEIRVFYDFVAAFQQHLFKTPLEILLKVVQLSLFGEIDADIGFEFIPLWQLDDKAASDVRKADVDADVALVEAGVLHPEEVRMKIASDKDSPYAGIDVSDVPPAPEGEEGDELGGLPTAEELAAAIEGGPAAAPQLPTAEVLAAALGQDAEFNEGDHPRADNGQFGSGGGARGGRNLHEREVEAAKAIGLSSKYSGSEAPKPELAVNNPLPRTEALNYQQTKDLPHSFISKQGEVKTLPIADLKTSQDFVMPSQVKGYQEYYWGMPMVAKAENGDLVIIDGNHRIVSKKLKGDNEVEVRYLGDLPRGYAAT